MLLLLLLLLRLLFADACYATRFISIAYAIIGCFIFQDITPWLCCQR